MFTILTNGDLRHLSGETSRFDASLTAWLHARSVPPVQNVDRSIAVSVVSMAAGGADEGRLILAASAVQCPAGRAALRSIGRIDLDQSGGFVGKHRFDLMPAYIKDRTVQSALLRNIPARRNNRASSRRRHALCSQALDNHGAVVAGNRGRGFMRPMLADARDLRLEPCETALGLGVSSGATLAAAYNALGLPGLALTGGEIGRQTVSGAIGEHNRNGNATVDANGQLVIVRRFVDEAADAHLPTQCGFGDGQFTYGPSQIAGHAKFYPSYFRQFYTAPSAVKPLHGNPGRCERKGIVDTFPLGLGEATKAFPSTAITFIKRLQRPLLRRDVNGPNEIKLGAQGGQFARLVNVVQGVPGYGVIAPPVIAPLFKRQVPHKAANARKLRERHFLIRRWAKGKRVAAKHDLTYNESAGYVNELPRRSQTDAVQGDLP